MKLSKFLCCTYNFSCISRLPHSFASQRRFSVGGTNVLYRSPPPVLNSFLHRKAQQFFYVSCPSAAPRFLQTVRKPPADCSDQPVLFSLQNAAFFVLRRGCRRVGANAPVRAADVPLVLAAPRSGQAAGLPSVRGRG